MTGTPPRNLISPRIETLDRIRGFALLGILIFNIQTYTLFFFLSPDQIYSFKMDSPDTYLFWAFPINLFIRGQFYTIYSFLFGLGFYLMLLKSSNAGLDSGRILQRRLWWLLLFGVLHGFVFWWGDVLHNYALLGFTLPLFVRKSVSTILKWIIGLAGFVVLFHVLRIGMNSPLVAYPDMEKFTLEIVSTWKFGSVGEVIRMQGEVLLVRYILLVNSGFEYLLHYEIMFLLGMVAGKLDLFTRVEELRQHLLRPAFLLLPVGLIIKAVALFGMLGISLLPGKYDTLLHRLADFIGTTFLALIYLTLLTYLFQNSRSRLFQWMGNAGRIGLTNYLGQTLLCSLIFYGYAGGLAGKLTLWQSLIAALGIYIFQVFCSNLWLRYFSTGPMEWLWRRWVYGVKDSLNNKTAR